MVVSAQREIGQGGAHGTREQDEAARRTGSGPVPLPLDEAERVRFRLMGALALDTTGGECLRGLSRAESLEYVELQRRGLDNDDAAFLRYILLGDRLAVAVAQARG